MKKIENTADNSCWYEFEEHEQELKKNFTLLAIEKALGKNLLGEILEKVDWVQEDLPSMITAIYRSRAELEYRRIQLWKETGIPNLDVVGYTFDTSTETIIPSAGSNKELP